MVFHGFSWALVGFYGFFKVVHVFFLFLKFTIINDAIVFLNHQDQCFYDVFEVHGPLYAIISDGCQPSDQQCNVCDVSVKSNADNDPQNYVGCHCAT